MNRRLDDIREQTIARAVQELNRYFDGLSKECDDPNSDINDFERATSESRRETDEIFTQAVGEVMSSMEPGAQKNAPNAGDGSG